MAWTYEDISNTVRNLCSMQDNTQLTDVKLLARANRYYQEQFPKDVRPLQLKSWYDLTLVDGTDTYDLKKDFYDKNVKIDPMAYISETSGYKETLLNVYYSVGNFYDVWVENADYTSTSYKGQPADVLLYNNELLFRKCPDGTYYVSFKCMRKPLVYNSAGTTSSNAFEADTDIPEQPEWGKLIAYGTAVDILTEMGNISDLQVVTNLYQEELTKVSSQDLNWFSQTRAIPRF